MKNLVCLGDSLTEGSDIPAGRAWPELVGNALNVEVINGGIGGDTTTGMMARFHPEVVARKPAFVFIMGGTNDLWWGQSINTVLANLFAMIVQARHHSITPVLALPPPVHVGLAGGNEFSPPRDGYDGFTEQTRRLRRAIQHYSDESDVALVDLHRPFVSQTGEIETALFLPDGLHPSPEGHQKMAAAIVQTFCRDLFFGLNGWLQQ